MMKKKAKNRHTKKAKNVQFISPYQTLDHSATSQQKGKAKKLAFLCAAFAQTAKKSAPKEYKTKSTMLDERKRRKIRVKTKLATRNEKQEQFVSA